MRQRIPFALVLFICSFSVNGYVCGQESLATPAIDATIYKDGAVQLREFGFGDWHGKCQEIVKLKKKICNLLSNVYEDSEHIVGSVLIATTDTGLPAIVVAFPPSQGERRPFSIEANQIIKIDGKAIKIEYSSVVAPTVCDNGCKYMFPLDSRLVYILNAGERAIISIPPIQDDRRSSRNKARSIQNIYFLSGNGFADTLNESTKKH